MPRPLHLAGLGLGLLLALGACDKMKAPAGSSEGAAAAGPAAAEAPKAADAKDACTAAAHQSLVGTGAGALDSATLPKGTRVIFPGMPVTMDYRADRLNIEIGKNDKVARVFCG